MEGIRQAVQQMRPPASMEDFERSVNKAIDLTPYKIRFMQIAEKETGGRFEVDGTNRELVSSLFYYFLDLPGKYDLNKGIWLEGPIGTGKSTLLNVFSAFTRHFGIGFKVFICSHVTSQYSLTGDLDMFIENANGYTGKPVDMGFDELGREPNPAGYYGNKMNVFEHILHIRYSLWQQRGIRTFITTNLDAAQIEKSYGDYIRDRRKEMFNIIPVTGESRR